MNNNSNIHKSPAPGFSPDNDPTAAQLAAAAAEIDLDLSGDPDALASAASALMHASDGLAQRASAMAYAVGLQLIAARGKYQYGDWSALVERVGITSQRDSELRRIAGRCAQLAPDARKRMLGLGKRKILALAALDHETIDAGYESGELDEWAMMPKAELTKKVRALAEDQHKHKAMVRTLTQTVAQLRMHGRAEQPRPELPEWYTLLRGESAYAADAIGVALDVLEAALREHFTREITGRDVLRESVAGALYNLLHAAGLRLQGLLDPMVEEFGARITGLVKPEFQLDPDEAALAEKRRRMIVENAQIAAGNRKVLRDSEGPRQRVGRPGKLKSLRPEV